MTIKYCATCKWSKLAPNGCNSLQCYEPRVVNKDEYALSGVNGPEIGTSCLHERAKEWIGVCGKSGKMWQPKEHHSCCS